MQGIKFYDEPISGAGAETGTYLSFFAKKSEKAGGPVAVKDATQLIAGVFGEEVGDGGKQIQHVLVKRRSLPG